MKPVVIINKIDKPAARIDEVLSEIESLFLELATDESQLFYPVYYAIAREGRAGKTPELDDDMHVIFDAIINDIPAPSVDSGNPNAQLLVAALAADNYLGKYCIGKIFRGKLKKGENVKILQKDAVKSGKIEKIFSYRGLGKEEVPEAIAGDIVAITGVAEANIGDTIATGDSPEALPTIELEAPTLSIYIGPNTSPLKGREGEFTTSRQIADFAASFQQTAIDILIEKLTLAKTKYPNVQSIVIAGGVSANQSLRSALPNAYFPAPSLSGDNGAMVAAAAYYEIQSGIKPVDPYKLNIYPRISIEH